MQKPTRSDEFSVLRDVLRGIGSPDSLPPTLRGLFQTIMRRRERQERRAFKRKVSATQHRMAALAGGGGSKEVARRRKAIFEMRLNASNGVVGL